MTTTKESPVGLDKLKDLSLQLLQNLGDRAVDTLNDKVGDLTGKITDLGDGAGVGGQAVAKAGEAAAQGDNPVLGGLKGAASGIKDKITGGGSKGGAKATKSTNIVETIDVGVPVRVAYNQWTEFGSFPSFMKKVENVEANDDNKLTWKAQVFLSHRTWEATVLEQQPDERIIWRSKGAKGHVDGAVTFHEIGPNLTRILVVLEYYPQGLFEKTGNIWEAQGRRARAEIRHFRRHVMTRTLLNPDEVEGWRGVIEDGEVVETHEDHVQREEQEESESEEQQHDEADGEPEAQDEDVPEDEAAEPEDESEEEEEGEEPEDEYEEEGEEEGEEPEDEYEEEGEEEGEEPEDEYEEEDEEEGEEEPEAEYEEEDEEEGEEEPEAEYEEEGEEEGEEPEAEYEDEAAEEEPEEEPRKKPARRRQLSRT